MTIAVDLGGKATKTKIKQTQNVKYYSEALLLGYIQVFFHPEVLDFLPIYFQHILSISGKPHLFSWERIDRSIFVCTF